jgi:2-polyprenyl-6-methoxyphenol hydroxylase-like FAD-dependent oxidoreductase
MRIIVIGSGIAGLSAAIALRQVGIEVAVYERAPELREVGAGISLWANALRALDHLGAGEAVRAVSLSLDHSEMRAEEGRRVQATFSGVHLEKRAGVRPFIAMSHRADLVGALAGFVPPGVARYGFECVGVEPKGQRVAVRFANGQADEADAVIGADGIKSTVRAALFGPQEPRYAGYTCWRGVCSRPGSIKAGYSGEWWGRGKRFGITTLTNDRVYWFAVCNAPAGSHSADELFAVARRFQGWSAPVPELIATTPQGHVIHNDILDRPPRRSWSVGRIGLIGDAAHATTPNLGQGGCLAIEDSVALARCLAAAQDPAAALVAFASERYGRTTVIMKESWRLGKIGQWEGRVSCWLRDRAFGFLLPAFGERLFSKHALFDIGPLTGRVGANAFGKVSPAKPANSGPFE